jgi:aryl-alcohol dehydrogenase-like predicted oxidoreductase
MTTLTTHERRAASEPITRLDHYRLLGRSGLRVSPLCLGAMTFGTDWGWGADRETCREIFDLYVGAGGNFIDTANFYTSGTSEELVGEFIAGHRERLVLATKYTLSMRQGDPNAGGITGRTWSRRSRRACAGSRPTPSTCTGCTPGTSPHPWTR